MLQRSAAGVVAVLMLLLLPVGAAVAETFRHTGTIVNDDGPVGTLVLAEIGPWRAARGVELTWLTIIVTDATEFVRVGRTAPRAGQPVGDFTEEPIGLWDVAPGDVVTVECLHEGREMIATRVIVVQVEGP
jgi:hypothetical protein